MAPLAEPSFDRARFVASLTTRRLGRSLIARAEVESTNDVAWDALGAGAADGTCVVADVQTRGRGRAGHAWHTAPGHGLAISVLMHQGCDRRQLGTLPLVAGLALARGLEMLGARAELKWPNDLLIAGRKVSGILAESRRTVEGTDAAVIGVGVNVSQSPEDFTQELRALATSLAMEGCVTSREAVAAAFLNALEPLWAEHQEGDRRAALEAWKERATFWGRTLRVTGAGRDVTGIARGLDDFGALILERETGEKVTVLAGDVEVLTPPTGNLA
ncbi:MAG: biotin--[acetyl-CoA-carboxylase] ligase [Candidatus Eisenbacteria bacterium]